MLNLTKNERISLNNNKNVLRLNKTITYTSEYKEKAIKEYLAGKTPIEVFISNGFKLSIIGKKKPRACISR